MNAIEYIRGFEEKVDPAATKGMQSRFHFILKGEGGAELTVVVDDGEIDVIEGLEGEPKCKVETKVDTFEKLIKKEINPMMAVLTGKVKISNQSELMKYAKIFGIL